MNRGKEKGSENENIPFFTTPKTGFEVRYNSKKDYEKLNKDERR